MGRYINVARPCVLKHKYHRHWNHGRPRVGFWGILGVPSIEPLLGGGGPAGGLYPPHPLRKRKPGLPRAWHHGLRDASRNIHLRSFGGPISVEEEWPTLETPA